MSNARKKSPFVPDSPKDLRAKAAWFGRKGMEKTANDFYNAADILEAALTELTAEKQRSERLVRLVQNGRNTIMAAIERGDWVVDGAADPDTFLAASLGDSNG